MKLDKETIELIEQMIEEKYIMKRKHPNADLWIYNYTQFAVFNSKWNKATVVCRGLILDGDYNIIARPFEKFFNYGELERVGLTVPDCNFKVYDKLDGSLGILYWLNNKPYIASRGSFDSEQAKIGTKILYDKYSDLFDRLPHEVTYLFEIIYPSNRIVIDYGDIRDIVLLAVIDDATGRVIDAGYGFKRVQQKYGMQDIKRVMDQIEFQDTGKEEGYVIQYDNGFRVKMKFGEYVRLHKLLTQTNKRDVWEVLKNGKDGGDVLDLLVGTPEEFRQWVISTIDELRDTYKTIEIQCKKDFKKIEHLKDMATRRENAEYIKQCKYPAILFKMLDNKRYDEVIWKLIKPRGDKVFKTEGVNHE